ncbi:MAG: Rieske (2Fe-2S) protein, partial [Pseudomonadota bacterium]
MRDIQIPKDWNRKGLPGWSYHSPALLELEIEEVFKSHWQIVCHVSDVPEAGSFYTFDMCGERAIVVRDQNNEIGVFHNICRHRGSRVVAQENGRCKGALVCPFHGWVYNLDGTLRGAARPDSFPQLDKHEFGLRP